MAFSDSKILALGLAQNPAPGGRILAPRTLGNLRFSFGGPTISAPGWRAGWGPVLAPLGCPGESSKFANSHFPPSNGPVNVKGRYWDGPATSGPRSGLSCASPACRAAPRLERLSCYIPQACPTKALLHQVQIQPTSRRHTQRSIGGGGGGNENSRIWSFHLDTLRVPKLVPHPALQPGAEVVDPSNGKRRFPRVRGAGIRPSGAGF